MVLTFEEAKSIMELNGGGLNLSGTGITALPDNLTVGGWLDLSGTGITNNNVLRLENGDYKPGRYIFVDGLLTHAKREKRINAYTYFVGKIPGKNVVFDGTNYAHCSNLREGISDLLFKAAKDRGADQYKNLTLDTEMSVDELVSMYRIITGACKQGSQAFVDSLGDSLKEKYTIKEAIELTKGQYGSEHFSQFFGQ